MSYCIIPASEADSVLKGKQKYCLSSMGPLDKKALKKGLKETAATMKKAHKETLRKCKKCEHYNKKCDYKYDSYSEWSEVCRDCGCGFEWKNYKERTND